MMFRVSPPGRRLAGVPVVPGYEPMAEGPCSACGTCSGAMVRKVIDHHDVTVCLDEQACRDRIVLAVMDGEL